MQQTLLLIPPDTRPPTLEFPVKLAQAVGLSVFTPPLEALNNLNQPGDFEILKTWLLENVSQSGPTDSFFFFFFFFMRATHFRWHDSSTAG